MLTLDENRRSVLMASVAMFVSIGGCMSPPPVPKIDGPEHERIYVLPIADLRAQPDNESEFLEISSSFLRSCSANLNRYGHLVSCESQNGPIGAITEEDLFQPNSSRIAQFGPK